MKILHTLFISASILFADFSYSQETKLRAIDSLVGAKQINQAFDALNDLDTSKLNNRYKAWFYKLLGRNQTLNNQENLAFENYLKAKIEYLALDSLDEVAEINLQIVQLLNASNSKSLDYHPFLNEYVNFAEKKNDPNLLSKAYMQIGKCFINSEPQKTILYFKKAAEENQKSEDSLMTAKINHNIGVLFAEHTPHLDSALYHYNIALKEYRRLDLTDYISYIYNNKATVFKKQGDYDSAISNYLKADSLPIEEYRKNNKKLLYGFLSDAYEKNNDYENATKYLKLHLTYKDSVGEDDQNKAMLEIQEKYDNQKLRADNLEIEAKRVRNRNWLVAAALALFLGSGIAILLQKNTNKKRLLAEKEVLLKQQRVENLLREQELLGIDAMISGQEKERQRLADDLHDNLGSILTSLKMHFQSLKQGLSNREEVEVTQKTEALMEEAYQKVRSIAHVRNAGLKANKGLLPAVHGFAKKVSVLDKLTVNVEEHGMTERLENSMEITLFRIVQELVTNVAKHANASECTVHLTNHNHTFNIMVEDNGEGFKTKEVTKKEGMGLYSIQKRVENLDGQVTIESIPNKGTSIIIDIPLA